MKISMRARISVLLLPVCVLLPGLGNAQSVRASAVHARGELTTLADTNVAEGYLRYGKQVLWKDPKRAAEAFYWAGRLDPMSTTALYGERIAILAQSEDRILDFYLRSSSSRERARLRTADSLMERAVRLDPLLHRPLDDELVARAVVALAARNIRLEGGEPNEAELHYWVRQSLDSESPLLAGWLAYGRGDLQSAARLWAAALRRTPERAYLWAERGRVFALMQQYDSARVHLRKAIELAQPSDTSVVAYYESKAPLLYTLGFIDESAGDFVSARENYQAALVEDLSYGAANVRLGLLALQQGDTALALTELDRATGVNNSDFAALLTAGYTYASVPRYAEAARHLQRAAVLEPYNAAVQLLTAQVLEANGDHAEAKGLYRRFLAVAPIDAAGRAQAERRLAALEAVKPN